MAMMASSTSPYDHDARSIDEDDLIDPDDAVLNELDDPLHQSSHSDRAPLTGGNNAASSSSRDPLPRSYLTSSIPGEDRRAPQNTLDETVWETLSRDLSAVWEKMRLVLWPNRLLGGFLNRAGNAGAMERGEGGEAESGGVSGVASRMRGLVHGRWPDADTVLQNGMSEGLRDWDLWYGFSLDIRKTPFHWDANMVPGVRCSSACYSVFSCHSEPHRIKSHLFSLASLL